MTKGFADRRTFLATTVGCLAGAQARAQLLITRPVVSEEACPLETIHPVASDGHRGLVRGVAAVSGWGSAPNSKPEVTTVASIVFTLIRMMFFGRFKQILL